MFSVSDEFLAAIASSHTIEVKATAYLGADVVAGAEDLLVLDGSVRTDAKANSRRTLDGLKVVSADGKTSSIRALLDVPGTELQVWRGVRFPAGTTELAPVGRFRLGGMNDELTEPGVVTISAPDRMAHIVDDRFLTPRAATSGATIPAQIADLITETLPTATVVDLSGATDTVPDGIVWERERIDAVNSLAASIGCTVYADPLGQFVIAPIPSVNSAADWVIAAGSTSVLVGGTRTTTREGVYNVVVASSSPTDGSAPVFGIAEDSNPTSPTYVSGPFGRVPRFYSSPLLTTDTQAADTAASLLAQALGKRGTLAVSTLVNPALEVGDRIDVSLPDGSLQHHIVDGFTLPLTADGSMPITTRSTEGEE